MAASVGRDYHPRLPVGHPLTYMYIDLSFKKIGSILLVCAMLWVTLLLTGNMKEHRYGSTPPFASVGLAWQEVTLRAWYAIEGTFWKFSRNANTATALTSKELTFERNDSFEPARGIPVLTYHRVVSDDNDLNNVTASAFRDQMLTLKRAGWETVSLEEYLAFVKGKRELPERSFLITFDDGAKESFYPVDPLFQALDYEGVIYVIASAAQTEESTYYLSSTEIKRMLKSGRWDIGSHSYDGHRPYQVSETRYDGIFFADKLWLSDKNRNETEAEFSERVEHDLVRARHELELEYGVPINTFAFPLGNETGIEGAANFPEGAPITERTAGNFYDVGFLQTNNQGYTFNFPQNGFIARRIHVDHDWDGERLLREMESGLAKNLPYNDDFSENKGWIPAWGALDLGRNNLTLQANNDASSASTFLDGSAFWNNYSFDASLNWSNGSVFLLADVKDSKTYDSCAFSDGKIRLQSTRNGETQVLAEVEDDSITYSADARMSIRVHDAVIECLWNYKSLVEAYDRTRTGGIGLQVWNPELGTASLQVSDVLVRPYETATSTTDIET